MGLRVAHRSTRRLTDASWFGGSHHGRWRASRDFQRLPKRLACSPSITPFHRAFIGTSSGNNSVGSVFHNDVAMAGNHLSAQRIAPFSKNLGLLSPRFL